MYKVIVIKEYGKKSSIQEFDNKPEAIATFLELINAECERHALASKYIRIDSEVRMRGDLFYSREDNYRGEYIVIVGNGLEEYRNPGKYKQIMKKYVNQLL